MSNSAENLNSKYFVWFRCLFNGRFYYPIFTVLFLDHGLSLEQFAVLNTLWAVSIVLLEVPSGALADIIGRRRLVISASFLMFIEMLCIYIVTPGSKWVFWAFALNRVFSGAAEAAASGADEAMTYDALAEAGREEVWAKLMAKTMRWQSVAFVVAMFVGAFVYDHEFINTWALRFGLGFEINKETAIKLPILLCLFTSMACIFVAFKMKEPIEQAEKKESFDLKECIHTANSAFAMTMQAGKWIMKTPAVFSVIIFAMVFDSIVRMFLTLNSEYYRTLGYSEASFGVIGAAMGLLGFVMPSIGLKLSKHLNKRQVAALLFSLCLIGLWGIQHSFEKHMLAFAFLLSATMSLVGYLTSLYLNKESSQKMRATVLSFKGLSFNLVYGSLGIIYSLLIVRLRETTQEDKLFENALSYFAPFFVVSIVLAVVCAYLQKKRSTIKFS